MPYFIALQSYYRARYFFLELD